MKKIYTLIIASLTISINCFSQTIDQQRFNHTTIEQYKLFHNEFVSAMKIPKDFEVSSSNGTLKIDLFNYVPVKRYSLDSGTLALLYHGNLGGGLFYQPYNASKDKIVANGQQVKKGDGSVDFSITVLKQTHPTLTWAKDSVFKVLGGNIPNLLPDSENFIFFLNDRLKDKSTLYRLIAKPDTFTTSKIFEFDGTGTFISTIYLRGDKIYLVGGKNFYIINKLTGKIEMELDNLFIDGSYPNSFTIINNENEVYIGMRSAYAKLNVQRRQVDFFIYQY